MKLHSALTRMSKIRN